MDYAQSSQARHWTFSREDVRRMREKVRSRVLDKLSRAGPSNDQHEWPEMLSVEDEVLLQRCWHYKLQDMCREETARTPERFTPRVMTTAHAYLRRFFLRRSIVEDDPREVLLAAVYLAAKVEEERIDLNDLTRYSRFSSEREAAERLILSNEEKILATLGYELVVRSPYRSLRGITASLREWSPGQNAHADVRREPAFSHEAVSLTEARARDFLCHALCSDAQLLYSPQQLALAGVLRGAAAAGIDLGRWFSERLPHPGGSDTSSDDRTAQLLQVCAGERPSSSNQCPNIAHAGTSRQHDVQCDGPC
mmetsp:Transcript_5798/g.18112  ORF Transcript_5798/g.18112 Transcript_5798/m.18112 type:complete len:308 (-) Transcript_5798:833-1756(-)